MKEILTFGTKGRECPCCVGPQAFKNSHFTREEIREQESLFGPHPKPKKGQEDKTKLEVMLEDTREKMQIHATGRYKSKVHDKEIREALAHQARISQLDHKGWDIEVHAWVNVCPDCDRVTEYRAAPAHKRKFTLDGPVNESESCTDCRKAKEKAALEAEMERRSKLTNEELAAEMAEEARLDSLITREYVNAEIAKAEANGGPTPTEFARILRLTNSISMTFREFEKKK